jgi:hypothetical protein
MQSTLLRTPSFLLRTDIIPIPSPDNTEKKQEARQRHTKQNKKRSLKPCPSQSLSLYHDTTFPAPPHDTQPCQLVPAPPSSQYLPTQQQQPRARSTAFHKPPLTPSSARFTKFYSSTTHPLRPPISGPSDSRVSLHRGTNAETPAYCLVRCRDTRHRKGPGPSTIRVTLVAAAHKLPRHSPRVPPALSRVSRTASVGTDSAGSFAVFCFQSPSRSQTGVVIVCPSNPLPTHHQLALPPLPPRFTHYTFDSTMRCMSSVNNVITSPAYRQEIGKEIKEIK